MPNSIERQQQIAAFFATNASRLRQTVARRARGLPDEAIEDACQTAWTILTRRPDINLNHSGLAWLIKVAVREAWRHHANACTETPSSALTVPHADHRDPSDLCELEADIRDIADQIADRIQHEQRLADLATLKPNDRRALYLRGLGYSYHEIMAITGATYTAVNRRITEGRQQLRKLEHNREHAHQTARSNTQEGGESSAAPA